MQERNASLQVRRLADLTQEIIRINSALNVYGFILYIMGYIPWSHGTGPAPWSGFPGGLVDYNSFKWKCILSSLNQFMGFVWFWYLQHLSPVFCFCIIYVFLSGSMRKEETEIHLQLINLFLQLIYSIPERQTLCLSFNLLYLLCTQLLLLHLLYKVIFIFIFHDILVVFKVQADVHKSIICNLNTFACFPFKQIILKIRLHHSPLN